MVSAIGMYGPNRDWHPSDVNFNSMMNFANNSYYDAKEHDRRQLKLNLDTGPVIWYWWINLILHYAMKNWIRNP